MRLLKKRLLGGIISGTLALGLIGGVQQAGAGDKYNATFYVAGMGGHFAEAEIVIDPAKTEAPLRIRKLDKIDIGDNLTHPTHDPRIDANDSTTMFWSTYKIDKSEEYANLRVAHVGKSDLRTGEVIMDRLVELPPQAVKDGSLYCGSGQSADHFIPITMTNKGYIDVFRKSDLTRVQRIFLEGSPADINRPYKYYHGTNSPDFSKMLVSINEAETAHGNMIGKIHLLELDMAELIQGRIKLLNKGLATGTGGFVSFRQYYSADGSMIANSAGNAMLLIDAKTLEVIDHEPMGVLEENHDAMFTPDGKYVVLTSRSKALLPDCENPTKPGPDEYIMDGQLKLYDVAAGKFIGEAVSVCSTCHQTEGIDQHAVLCGVDAVYH